MKKKFKVLFFQVDMGLNRSTFADLLQRIQLLSPEERTAESKNLRLGSLLKNCFDYSIKRSIFELRT